MLKKLLSLFKKPEKPKTPKAGRKPKPTDQKTINKIIALYPEEWKKIDAIAREKGLSRSGVIRSALDAMEAQQKAERQ